MRSLLEDALGARGVLERKLDKFGDLHQADRKRIKELEAEVAELHNRNAREGHASDGLSKALRDRMAELRAAEAARDGFRAERDSMRAEQARASSYHAQRNARTEQALKDEAARSKKLAEQVRSLENRLSTADKARDAAAKYLEKQETAQAVATHALKEKLAGVEEELGRAREEVAQSRSSEEAAKKDVKVAEAHLEEALKKCDELNTAKSASAPSRSDLVSLGPRRTALTSSYRPRRRARHPAGPRRSRHRRARRGGPPDQGRARTARRPPRPPREEARSARSRLGPQRARPRCVRTPSYVHSSYRHALTLPLTQP